MKGKLHRDRTSADSEINYVVEWEIEKAYVSLNEAYFTHHLS
jgi:hypothetical protein